MNVLLPSGTAGVSPLVLAIQANYNDDPDIESQLPNTVQILLWSCCALDNVGAPEISPLSVAIRYSDHMAVSQLLQRQANPSRREEFDKAPIFLAIQNSMAEVVQLLLQFRADPRSREAIPADEGTATDGRREACHRTALEVAECFPRCRRVLLDFIDDATN